MEAEAGLTDELVVEFRGGYSSVERDGVAHLFEPKPEQPWPVQQQPHECKRIIGYAGFLPRDIRSARERSSAPISSALYSTYAPVTKATPVE